MKTFFIITFILLTAVLTFLSFSEFNNISKPQRVNAKYLGFESGIYTFKDDKGNTIFFDTFIDTLKPKYDLKSNKYINRSFFIIREKHFDYIVNQEESYDYNKIIDLVLIE